MAIVSCTACSKKLKVADTSVGKKVKCSCGNIFVAQEGEGAAVAPAVAPPPSLAGGVPEKVFVACTECGAKLKVGTGSLGKKMKCPKCTGVFVASLADDAPPPPAPPKPGPPMVVAAPKDDADDLFTLAQSESESSASNGELTDLEEEAPAPKARKSALDDEDDDDMPRSKGKGKKPDDDDDDDDDRPKAKGKQPPRRDDDKAEPLKYPSRLLVNLLVFFLLFAYLAAFAMIVFEVIERATLEGFGWPAAPKPTPKKFTPAVKNGKQTDNGDLTARQKEEQAWLEEIRKLPKPDVPKVLAVLPSAGAERIDSIAFAPTGSLLAVAGRNSDKEGIKIWDLKTLKPTAIIPIEAEGLTLQFSPDGQYLAGLSADPAFLKVWKAADGAEAHSFPIKNGVQDFAFSADGKRLAVLASKNADVQLFKVGSWEAETFTVKKNDKSRFLLVPASNKILELNEPDKRLTIHDLADGKSKDVKYENPIPLERAVASPSGTLVLFVEDKGPLSNLSVFDLDKAEAVTLMQASAKLTVGPFSPDGNLIGTTLVSERGIHSGLYDVTKKEQAVSFTGASRLYVSPGGVFFARDVGNAVHLMTFADFKEAPPAK